MRRSKPRTSLSLDPYLARLILARCDPATAALVADVLRLAFNEDEPRDAHGKWTTGGSSAVRPEATPAKPARSKALPSLPAAPFPTFANPEFSAMGWFLKGAGKPPGVIEKEWGKITPSTPSVKMGAKNTQGAPGGQTMVAKGIPDRFLVGSGGAGTCTIALVSIPSSTKPGTYDVVVSHFNPGQDPSAVWAKIGPFPDGTRVAMAGGDDSYASNTQRLVTIASLAYKKGVKIDGYFSGNGLWVDNRGKYYAFDVDRGKGLGGVKQKQ